MFYAQTNYMCASSFSFEQRKKIHNFSSIVNNIHYKKGLYYN